VRDVIRIGEQVARALDAMHREGVYFRDLKPGNVLLGGEGTAKLCDFGYALKAGQAHVTPHELVVGSLAYIAPERVARRHYDHRSDLYSLGILLYELLAGHPPFDSDDIQEVGSQHLHAEPPPLAEARPNTPDALVDLIGRLLAKGVGERPESAAHVAAELARIRDAL
jgi:serine/threonine-protein kinase